MKKFNVHVTPVQIKNKMLNFLKSYKKVLSNKKASGRGRMDSQFES